MKAQGAYHKLVVPRGVPAAIAVPPAARVAPVPQPVETPDVMLLKVRPATMFGLSPLLPRTPDSERLPVSVTLKGYPVWSDTMLLTHQPFKIPPTNPLAYVFGRL